MSRAEECPEVWRAVPGFEGYYEVSTLGRVRGVARTVERKGMSPAHYRTRLLSLATHRGYRTVGLMRGGVHSTHRVHRLVLEAFVGPGDGFQACHKNGDRADNRIENLYWGTNSDNQYDSVRHGTHVQARRTHCPQGHPYDEANTAYSVAGARRCRECVRRSTRESMRRNHGYRERREGYCFRGHEQTPENSGVYVWNGKERRRCKVCAAMRARVRRAERRTRQ